jgi:O-antigen/teichoic acid export membrane protein
MDRRFGPYAVPRLVVLVVAAVLVGVLISNDVAWAVAAVVLVGLYVLSGWWLQRREYRKANSTTQRS